MLIIDLPSLLFANAGSPLREGAELREAEEQAERALNATVGDVRALRLRRVQAAGDAYTHEALEALERGDDEIVVLPNASAPPWRRTLCPELSAARAEGHREHPASLWEALERAAEVLAHDGAEVVRPRPYRADAGYLVSADGMPLVGACGEPLPLPGLVGSARDCIAGLVWTWWSAEQARGGDRGTKSELEGPRGQGVHGQPDGRAGHDGRGQGAAGSRSDGAWAQGRDGGRETRRGDALDDGGPERPGGGVQGHRRAPQGSALRVVTAAPSSHSPHRAALFSLLALGCEVQARTVVRVAGAAESIEWPVLSGLLVGWPPWHAHVGVPLAVVADWIALQSLLPGLGPVQARAVLQAPSGAWRTAEQARQAAREGQPVPTCAATISAGQRRGQERRRALPARYWGPTGLLVAAGAQALARVVACAGLRPCETERSGDYGRGQRREGEARGMVGADEARDGRGGAADVRGGGSCPPPSQRTGSTDAGEHREGDRVDAQAEPALSGPSAADGCALCGRSEQEHDDAACSFGWTPHEDTTRGRPRETDAGATPVRQHGGAGQHAAGPGSNPGAPPATTTPRPRAPKEQTMTDIDTNHRAARTPPAPDAEYEDAGRPGASLARRADIERYDIEIAVPRETERIEIVMRAITRAQAKFNRVVKTKKADVTRRDGTKGAKYSYTNLADTCRETLPQLQEEGVFPSWRCAGNRVFMRLTHAESGEWIESDLPLAAPTRGSDAQALGAVLSYLRRYLYTMMLGIVPEDDPDDDASGAAAAGKMTSGLVLFVLDCAEGKVDADAQPPRPLTRADLVAAMKASREPALVQQAALRLFDERCPAPATRAA